MNLRIVLCALHQSKLPTQSLFDEGTTRNSIARVFTARVLTMVRRAGLAGAISAMALVGPAAQAADIVIGQVAPLSGVLATTGKQMVLGGTIYFKHINATGGVNGQKIVVKVVDDAYKVDETVRLTKEMLADPEVVALFGFAGTSNIGKLLSDGVLAQGGAALVAPYTGGEPLRNPFLRPSRLAY